MGKVIRWAMVWMAMVTGGWAAQVERRTAEATFHWVDGCQEVWSTLTLTQASIQVSDQFPDGWLRNALLTVEVNDTCAGTQSLNAAGQAGLLPEELSIDRKLDGATIAGWVDVWDGLSQSPGRFWVQASWVGVGAISRSYRAIVRGAEATLAADGMGISLRNATTQASLKTEVLK